MITILFIIIIIILIVNAVYVDNKEIDAKINRSFTEDWIDFAKHVESKHFLYKYDEETTKWIIKHKDTEWQILENLIPDKVKSHFTHFIATKNAK